MKNKILASITALCAALVLVGGFSVTAYAQTPTEETDDSGVIVETEPQPLTPEGNMTLVDDIDGDAAEDKQFIVVKSKGGNYFYIIVDRAAEGENSVHFLNQVDESDLMAIIGEEQTEQPPAVCNCTEKCKAGEVNTACPACSVNMDSCTGKEAAPVQPIHAARDQRLGNAAGLRDVGCGILLRRIVAQEQQHRGFVRRKLVSSGRILKAASVQLFQLGRILQKIVFPVEHSTASLPNASIISMVLQFVNSINHLFVNNLQNQNGRPHSAGSGRSAHRKALFHATQSTPVGKFPIGKVNAILRQAGRLLHRGERGLSKGFLVFKLGRAVAAHIQERQLPFSPRKIHAVSIRNINHQLCLGLARDHADFAAQLAFERVFLLFGKDFGRRNTNIRHNKHPVFNCFFYYSILPPL